MTTGKEKFFEIARHNIKRDGLEDLLKMLEKTDFFTAPASTKYHASYEGGLVDHSIGVYEELKFEVSYLPRVTQESIAVVALFHDICKSGYYKVDYRNTKDDRGNWIKVPYYTVEDKLPFGHGEKSVFMINSVMKLSVEEAMAIRWHMGGFEPKENYSTLSVAYNEFPLALHLHLADMRATYLRDKKGT